MYKIIANYLLVFMKFVIGILRRKTVRFPLDNFTLSSLHSSTLQSINLNMLSAPQVQPPPVVEPEFTTLDSQQLGVLHPYSLKTLYGFILSASAPQPQFILDSEPLSGLQPYNLKILYPYTLSAPANRPERHVVYFPVVFR